MPSSNSSRDALLGRLADEFVARHRDGERPALTEYTGRHPELADDIKELFPALVQIERLKPAAGELTGAFDAAAPPPKLERLGEYRVLREVGRGGMGVVYEAEQESLGRHVALKVLPSSALINPTYRERFRREAKAAARLHHTNIVPVFGVGEADGVPYYAMQFIRGEGLDRVLADVRRLRSGQTPITVANEGSLANSLLTGQFHVSAEAAAQAPPSTATSGLTVSGPEAEYCRGVARLGAQVAEALSYAHKQGILHRDIKPSNLLLDAQGTVWVTDFGLAKAEGSDELTGTGDIVGTLRFMAPERFDGRSLPQSDVYALGATLYEMLTLRPAFDDANKAKLIDRALHEPPLAPRAIDARIPRDLETVVLKCLAKAPEERYATAEALADDLRRFLADRPIHARRASNAEKAWRWCRRNPALATLTAAVALSLVLGTVVASLFAVRADANAREANEEREKVAAAELAGRHKLFEAYLAEARANRFARRSGQRFDTLARLADAVKLARELDLPPERFEELRHVAITALAMPDLSPRRLGDIPAGYTVRDLSDDLTRVLMWDEQAKATVIRSVADGAELLRIPADPGEGPASFAVGGRYLIRRRPGTPGERVELYDFSGDKLRPVPGGAFARLANWDLRPDGRFMLLVDDSGAMELREVASEKVVGRLPAASERHPAIALHPSEPLVATCSYFTRRVLLRDFRTGTIAHSVAPPWPAGSTHLVWHPDGRRLFVAAGDSRDLQEYHFDAAARQLRPGRLLQAPSSAWGGNVLAINPAGDRLATRGWGMVAGLLDLETGRTLYDAKHMGTIGGHFRFTADGEAIIGMHGTSPKGAYYGVINVGDAREVRAIPLSYATGHRPVVHPGGRLAVIPQTNRFTFVDLASLRELGVVMRSNGRRPFHMAFDGEGRLYTNSSEGCFRWPVRLDGEKLTVGPPERLPFHPGTEVIAVSDDGQTIAQAQFAGYDMAQWAGGWLLTPGRDDPLYLTVPQHGMTQAAVSRDGRWVCFGVHTQPLKVYDPRTGKEVWSDGGAAGGASCRFTRDGRWLVGNHRAFRVGDWQSNVLLDPSGLGSLFDVSPDSRQALLSTPEGYVRLVEIATGRELARFEPPEGGFGQMGFTTDGTRILEPSSEGLRVWDLRRIRKRLARLGLDWDAPAYPEEAQAPADLPPPLQLTIHGGDLLSDPAKLRAYDEQRLSSRLAKDPFDADGNLELARGLMRAGRIGQALRHLERALLTRPRSYPVRMNRAICLMRLGRPERAVADYTAAAAARPGDYRPYYGRSFAYRRLGKHALAVADLTEVLKYYPEDGELYEERADCYKALGDKAREAADRASARRHDPREPQLLNRRAWFLLTDPPGSRDDKRALAMIRKAVEMEPDNPLYQNTLGVALYRNGEWTKAVEALNKSLARTAKQYAAWDLYFLAMCHAKMGEPEEAKKYFDRAVTAGDAVVKGLDARHQRELRDFRREAEEVLRGAK